MKLSWAPDSQVETHENRNRGSQAKDSNHEAASLEIETETATGEGTSLYHWNLPHFVASHADFQIVFHLSCYVYSATILCCLNSTGCGLDCAAMHSFVNYRFEKHNLCLGSDQNYKKGNTFCFYPEL